MEVRYLIIARYAEFLPDGSVNILGGDSDIILAESFPATHPLLSVATRLAMSREDATKEHIFKTCIFGPDREVVQEGVSGTIQTFDLPAETVEMGVGIMMQFSNIIFPKAAWYKISLLIDDREVGTAPLRVQEREKREEFQRMIQEKFQRNKQDAPNDSN
jgi:hypothetical protein